MGGKRLELTNQRQIPFYRPQEGAEISPGELGARGELIMEPLHSYNMLMNIWGKAR